MLDQRFIFGPKIEFFGQFVSIDRNLMALGGQILYALLSIINVSELLNIVLKHG